MPVDPSLKAELIYGLDISELDPYSAEFQQTTDLICLCRLYDRFHDCLLPVEYNALLHAIECQCQAAGVPFASLQLTPQDEGDWRDHIAEQNQYSSPLSVAQLDQAGEAAARRIAGRKLLGTGYVLRRGPSIRDGEVWRFPVRLADEPDVPYDGRSMTVMVRVGPEDKAI